MSHAQELLSVSAFGCAGWRLNRLAVMAPELSTFWANVTLRGFVTRVPRPDRISDLTQCRCPKRVSSALRLQDESPAALATAFPGESSLRAGHGAGDGCQTHTYCPRTAAPSRQADNSKGWVRGAGKFTAHLRGEFRGALSLPEKARPLDGVTIPRPRSAEPAPFRPAALCDCSSQPLFLSRVSRFQWKIAGSPRP